MGYFESTGWQQDYTNLLKSILLISKRLEELTLEMSNVSEAIHNLSPILQNNKSTE